MHLHSARKAHFVQNLQNGEKIFGQIVLLEFQISREATRGHHVLDPSQERSPRGSQNAFPRKRKKKGPR